MPIAVPSSLFIMICYEFSYLCCLVLLEVLWCIVVWCVFAGCYDVLRIFSQILLDDFAFDVFFFVMCCKFSHSCCFVVYIVVLDVCWDVTNILTDVVR